MALTRRELLAAGLAPAAPKPPNVLVFFSDQESALLPGPAELPNRRRIERGALRFTHAFCNTPQCSAARSSLLTGLPPHRTGVLTNVDRTSLGKPLPATLPTAGSVFKAAGYSTGYFGKWHLGGGPDRAPYGFDTTGVETGDERIAQEAAEWIRGRRGPWLAWVSVLNPHDIYRINRLREAPLREGVRPPASGLEDLKGKPAEQQAYVDRDQGRITRHYNPRDWLRYRGYYLRLVETVDAHLGTVLDAVPDLESTVVVYTSDHGDALGEHGLPFKGPFMYEENIRVPLIIRAPGLRGGERTDLATSADVAPTLASLAGLRWPGAPGGGRDLTRSAAPDAVFLEYYAKQKWVNPIRTIRTRRWKLNQYDRGNRELYDLERDPHELHNLAGEADTAAVEAALEARIAAWRPPMVS